nr:hypothetical protein [Herpetosiphon sp.]
VFALVIGPDDLAAGVVQLKDLRTGEQRAIARADIVSTIQQARRGA